MFDKDTLQLYFESDFSDGGKSIFSNSLTPALIARFVITFASKDTLAPACTSLFVTCSSGSSPMEPFNFFAWFVKITKMQPAMIAETECKSDRFLQPLVMSANMMLVPALLKIIVPKLIPQPNRAVALATYSEMKIVRNKMMKCNN